MNVKQVIVIRKDLKMRRGKEIAQGAHAASAWLMHRVQSRMEIGLIGHNDFTAAEMAWMRNQHTKVTVQVAGEKELHEVFQAAKNAGLTVHLITDAGATEFHGVPTKTCLAIGPNLSEEIDHVTGDLKLY